MNLAFADLAADFGQDENDLPLADASEFRANLDQLLPFGDIQAVKLIGFQKKLNINGVHPLADETLVLAWQRVGGQIQYPLILIVLKDNGDIEVLEIDMINGVDKLFKA